MQRIYSWGEGGGGVRVTSALEARYANAILDLIAVGGEINTRPHIYEVHATRAVSKGQSLPEGGD